MPRRLLAALRRVDKVLDRTIGDNFLLAGGCGFGVGLVFIALWAWGC